jgi:hypothetical protein
MSCAALPLRAEVAPASSSSIVRVDIGLSEWFSQGNTQWSHNASALDANLGNPSSKLQYKDTGTNITEITGRVKLKNKVFFRGAFGYGSIGGGRLTDDDFLSAQGAASARGDRQRRTSVLAHVQRYRRRQSLVSQR